MKKVLMSFVALVAIAAAATGPARAQSGSLLTTITPDGSGNITYSVADRATLDKGSAAYNSNDGWRSGNVTTNLTVTAAEGVNITSVKFNTSENGGSWTDTEAPFQVTLMGGYVLSANYDMLETGVTSIEVYGTYTAPAPKYTVKMAPGTEDSTSWSFNPGEAATTGVAESTVVNISYGGTRKVKEVVATVTYPEGAVSLATPLTIEALTAGTIVVLSPKNGMQYSLNGGAKQAVSGNTANIPVAAGDKVAFYGNGTSITSYDGTRIGGSGDGFTCKVYGNIMSLVDEDGYETATTLSNHTYVFYELFSGNTALTDASQLLLPATELANSCYYSMFRYCVNLTAGPAELPATELTNSCYSYMFYGCSSLTAGPALPATELATSCYRYMFQNCSSLTAAPELPATTLVSNCYQKMFQNCPNLSSVTCLATSGINESSSTTNWLYGAGDNVTGTKTFTAASSATWPEGNNGIPSGWTRVNQ